MDAGDRSAGMGHDARRRALRHDAISRRGAVAPGPASPRGQELAADGRPSRSHRPSLLRHGSEFRAGGVVSRRGALRDGRAGGGVGRFQGRARGASEPRARSEQHRDVPDAARPARRCGADLQEGDPDRSSVRGGTGQSRVSAPQPGKGSRSL